MSLQLNGAIATRDPTIEEQIGVNRRDVLDSEFVVKSGFQRCAFPEADPRKDVFADAMLLNAFKLDRRIDFTLNAGVLANHVRTLPPRIEVERPHQRLVKILLEIVGAHRYGARNGAGRCVVRV